MKVIAELVDMIEDELEGADNYAETALRLKNDYPVLAKKLNELAGEEMGHFKILHTEIAKLIEEYRKQYGEPPKEMLAVYRYEHDKQIRQAAEIRAMIDSFNS